MTQNHRILIFAFCLSTYFTMVGHADSLLIDAFSYGSADRAAATWTAGNGSPVAFPAPTSGMILNLPFRSPDIDRVYWDRKGTWDFSAADTFLLDLSCERPEAMRTFMVYFKSGDGWYVWGRPLTSAGRQTVHMMKSDFSIEGKPAGWDKIEMIRLSPWSSARINTSIILHQFWAQSTSILLVQGTLSVPEKAERTVAQRMTQRLSQWMKDVNLPHRIITDEKLTSEALERSRIVILGYNPQLPTAQRNLLDTFMEKGGQVMVFYSSDAQLANLMGFRLGTYMVGNGAASRWTAMAFLDAAASRMPERVYQSSWNIRPAFPTSETARVLAWWEDTEGNRTAEPAWVKSPKGMWCSHIMLPGDDANKRMMLAGLLAQLDPDLWTGLAQYAIQTGGRVGPFGSWSAASEGLRAAARSADDEKRVYALLDRATETHRTMMQNFNAGKFPETLDAYRTLQALVTESYARIQKPVKGELRGIWDHNGTGLYPGDWERTAKLAAETGMNALFINVMWGGAAHYESNVLPRSNTYRLYGDQIEQCLKAARKYGLQVHVWVVCWSLTGAPDDFVQRMRASDRLIKDGQGNEMPWLNPAHPENVALLINALKEVADRYPVDGLHLDYIRYPSQPACYSAYSRQRFEAWLGRKVKNWPADALPGGTQGDAYQRFRVDQINLIVRGIHRQIGKAYPKIKISAAVWGGYPDVIKSIGQDWAEWLKRGEVDFVVPMNYTADNSKFEHLTRSQMKLPGARGRLYPGIGVTSSESQLTPDQVIQQINTARALGAKGFVLFDLNNTLRAETLPALSLGITKQN